MNSIKEKTASTIANAAVGKEPCDVAGNSQFEHCKDSEFLPNPASTMQQLSDAQTPDDEEKQFYTLTELLENPLTEIPFLIKPILQRSGLALMFGASDTGKSTFLRQLCISIASKKSDFLGFEINAIHNAAVYVSTEDDGASIGCLTNKQIKEMNIAPAELAAVRYVFDFDDLPTTLDEILTVTPADVVCVDALSDVITQNLNDAAKMREYMRPYNRVAKKHKCLILFLHHSGKRAEDYNTPSKHNAVGSESIQSKCRVALELRQDYGDATLRHLCIVKGNYIPADMKRDSYVLRFSNNMVFSNTGERKPFDELIKKQTLSEAKTDAKNKVFELVDAGKTQTEIVAATGIPQPTVSRWMKEHKNNSTNIQTNIQTNNDVNNDSDTGEASAANNDGRPF